MFLIFFGVLLNIHAADHPQHSVEREQGLVPDKDTAVRVAEAVLIPIYGTELTFKEKPLTAVLTNEMWIIKNNSRPNSETNIILRISKKDARISLVNAAKHALQASRRGQGVVPDATTAARIAEAVLTPIYGQELVSHERPFKSVLKEKVWIVQGTLHQGLMDRFFGPTKGGVGIVELSREDAAILRVSHGK